MMTGAFSRNIGKLFSELKLVTDNLPQLVSTAECSSHHQGRLTIQWKHWQVISELKLVSENLRSQHSQLTSPCSICEEKELGVARLLLAECLCFQGVILQATLLYKLQPTDDAPFKTAGQ